MSGIRDHRNYSNNKYDEEVGVPQNHKFYYY